jgi:hypothetical protein
VTLVIAALVLARAALKHTYSIPHVQHLPVMVEQQAIPVRAPDAQSRIRPITQSEGKNKQQIPQRATSKDLGRHSPSKRTTVTRSKRTAEADKDEVVVRHYKNGAWQ